MVNPDALQRLFEHLGEVVDVRRPVILRLEALELQVILRDVRSVQQ